MEALCKSLLPPSTGSRELFSPRETERINVFPSMITGSDILFMLAETELINTCTIFVDLYAQLDVGSIHCGLEQSGLLE